MLSVRFLMLRCSSSQSNLLRVGIAGGFSQSRCFSVSVPADDNTKYSVTDLAMNSVVKVFCRSTEFSVLQPWQKRMPQKCSGSGFVISGNKILTNAHVVADHTFVKVRKHGSPTLYKATVEAVGHECDLAILKIVSKKFWENISPLELGDIPNMQQPVFVVGYPKGGDSICITKGVVTRVELGRYSHGGTNLMRIQTDAAINSGNSGGPVVLENKVVGVAFQSMFFAQNTGYIIPTPVINYFLSGVDEKGKFVGFCSLGISCQLMRDAELLKYFKMSRKMTGILIKKVNPLSSAYNVLKRDDILLSIDGVSIESDQTVVLRKKERIHFNHLVSMKKPGETASLKILREGKEHKLDINMKPVETLIPEHLYDKTPSYYILGGYVFLPLTKPYMDYADISPSVLDKMPKKAGEQIVIISQVLEDDINTAYTDFEDLQVEKVNGVQVENLRHLYSLIKNCSAEQLRLELEKENTIVLNLNAARKATKKILKCYGIPSPMSEDLKSVV